jgi:anti-anti-sigma regulatory factor
LEQRRHPRYQLVAPLVGVVEQSGGRYPGSVLNISAGGFYLHLPKLPPGNLKVHGADDYGEIHYAGRNAFGFGAIVRVEKFPQSVAIGFCWDKEGMDAKSSQLLGDMIKEQEARRVFGQVKASGRVISLHGHVSSAISQDVFSVLQTLGAAQVELSLAECVSIDSSGIELLMALKDRGVRIVDVTPEIEAVLRRFQLLGERKAPDAG